MTEEIKKLIEEEAKNYASNINLKLISESTTDHNVRKYHSKRDFEKGAFLILSKWQEAERWRKVEEELPEVFGAGTSIPVLVKTKYGTYHVAVYSKPHDDFIEIPYSVAGVTEWKPIS